MKPARQSAGCTTSPSTTSRRNLGLYRFDQRHDLLDVESWPFVVVPGAGALQAARVAPYELCPVRRAEDAAEPVALGDRARADMFALAEAGVPAPDPRRREVGQLGATRTPGPGRGATGSRSAPQVRGRTPGLCASHSPANFPNWTCPPQGPTAVLCKHKRSNAPGLTNRRYD